jgi:hypothetical protein
LFHCGLCDFSLEGEEAEIASQMAEHVAAEHPTAVLAEEAPPEQPQPSVFVCKCGKEYKTERGYDKHVITCEAAFEEDLFETLNRITRQLTQQGDVDVFKSIDEKIETAASSYAAYHEGRTLLARQKEVLEKLQEKDEEVKGTMPQIKARISWLHPIVVALETCLILMEGETWFELGQASWDLTVGRLEREKRIEALAEENQKALSVALQAVARLPRESEKFHNLIYGRSFIPTRDGKSSEPLINSAWTWLNSKAKKLGVAAKDRHWELLSESLEEVFGGTVCRYINFSSKQGIEYVEKGLEEGKVVEKKIWLDADEGFNKQSAFEEFAQMLYTVWWNYRQTPWLRLNGNAMKYGSSAETPELGVLERRTPSRYENKSDEQLLAMPELGDSALYFAPARDILNGRERDRDNPRSKERKGKARGGKKRGRRGV